MQHHTVQMSARCSGNSYKSAIESGRIKFGTSKAQKPMKIDQHPFPANMLEAKGKTKVLTSEAAEKNASVDTQHRITTDDAKSKGLLGESSSKEWRCLFFIHCWEEGIKLPTVENCPECNGYYGVNRSERRFQPGN